MAGIAVVDDVGVASNTKGLTQVLSVWARGRDIEASVYILRIHAPETVTRSRVRDPGKLGVIDAVANSNGNNRDMMVLT